MYIKDIHSAENLTENTFSADYSYFALWKEARPFISEIRKYLSTNFEIIVETKITWSDVYFKQNAARLYEVPIYGNAKDEEVPVDYTHKIGETQFTVFVVKDATPDYNYHPTASGTIEFSNTAFMEAKRIFRSWVAKNSASKYAVHSSTNFKEFCFQIPLLLGVDYFNQIVNGVKPEISSLHKDLEGAGGWQTAREMFDVLNCATKYLLLRNFKSIPAGKSLGDLDFLTDKFQRLASALGLRQKIAKPYKGFVTIAHTEVPVDIRFTGDNYYCSAWANNVLLKRIRHNDMYVPATDHYFFTLLYHAAVQKPAINKAYKIELNTLANELNLHWFSAEILENEKKIASVLNGYMMANGYFYERPLDEAVFENKNVISQIPARASLGVKKSFKIKTKQALLPFVPKSWYFYYLKLRTGRTYGSRK